MHSLWSRATVKSTVKSISDVTYLKKSPKSLSPKSSNVREVDHAKPLRSKISMEISPGKNLKIYYLYYG